MAAGLIFSHETITTKEGKLVRKENSKIVL